jgi:CTD small phosphatase-like protein 2
MVIPIPIEDPDASTDHVNAEINVRPHLLYCLEELSHYYQLIVFTASEQSYADAILDKIDPAHQLFEHRLYR